MDHLVWGRVPAIDCLKNFFSLPPGSSASQTSDELQKEHIIQILELTDGRISGETGAAKILGLGRTTLQSRMKKLEIKIDKKSAEI